MRIVAGILTLLIACGSARQASAYDEKQLDSMLNGTAQPVVAEPAPASIESPVSEDKQIKRQTATSPSTANPQQTADAPAVSNQELRRRGANTAHSLASDPLTAKFASLSHIPNFIAVTPRILRGGQPTDLDLVKMKAAGVTAIINLRNEEVLVKREEQRAKALGMKFYNIPMDVFNKPTPSTIKKFFSVIDNSNNHPVYVHCLHGQDRTGTMMALFRIERQGWSANQAYTEMVSCGFRPGFSRLSEVVFDRADALGVGGVRPSGGAIVNDLRNRILKRPSNQ